MPATDPIANFRFLVEIDGIVQAGFADCSGLSSTIESIEYREGGDSLTVRKLPGKISYADITLKWGLTATRELYDWHAQCASGSLPLPRKNGSIVLLDRSGQEAVRWNFFAAWPTKWEAPSLSAKGNEMAIATLTVTCERVEQAG